MIDEEAIAAAILRAASMLGNGNASTPMGAIEAHGLKAY
jgi:spore maturation protein SpmA